MGSGLLQRAMPGSLYPAFTHSDSQRRLQSQCSGLVPSALGAEQEVRVPPPSWAPGSIPLALWRQSFQALARLGVSGMSTSGLQTAPPTPGDVSTLAKPLRL